MIRASGLRGRAVVDMDAAEKMGHVEEVLLDPENSRVAGFILAQGQSLFGSNTSKTLLSASAVHAIGPDALTVHQAGDSAQASDLLARMPRMSDVIGRKIVSQSGKMLGVIEDVLVNGENGRIVGYSLSSSTALGKLENLFGAAKEGATDYVRGDADLRVGKDVVVVPDDAIMRHQPTSEQPAQAASEEEKRAAEVPLSRWSAPSSPNTSSAWRKVTGAETGTESTFPSSGREK
ncbi:MAG: PRC-barrel domain-containing protein [Acidobacteriota bacterium]|nr:PRC-barrel domain-containing protein [Acidobacteriota bacterium]